MDILSVVAAVFKRWYVTVPIVLVALVAAYVVHSNIPPQFEASGQILLASPELDPTGLPRTVVNLEEVAGQASTASAQAEMVEGEADLTITARVGAFNLTVTGSTADVVEGTYSNAVQWLGDAIAQRQDDAGIATLEQLVLQQDGETEAREREEGGFELRGRLALTDPAATVPNPYGANNATARILIVAVRSDAGEMRAAELTGPDIGFEVGQDARDAAAIINITTSGSEPQRVIEAYDHVADMIETELTEREARAEVPETRRTQVERIAAPQEVVDVSPPLDRSVAAIVGLGGIIAVIVAVLLESIATRRTTQRHTQPRDGFAASSTGTLAANSRPPAGQSEATARTPTASDRSDPNGALVSGAGGESDD